MINTRGQKRNRHAAVKTANDTHLERGGERGEWEHVGAFYILLSTECMHKSVQFNVRINPFIHSIHVHTGC